MKLRLTLFLVCAGILFAGCSIERGSGNKATETRQVAPFTSVEIEGATDVVIEVGGQQSVTVEADDNLISMIKTEVVSERLVISVEGNYVTTLGMDVRITVPRLQAISVDGSGDVKVSGSINEGLLVGVDGSGDVEIHGIDADKAVFTANGSGDVKAAGQVAELIVRTSGSGDADLSKLIAANVAVTSGGSGDTRVHATEKIHVGSSGSGDVKYRGAAQVTTSATGSGDITQE